jgi:peptidoglycan hydrolase CwlO-like protein
VLVVLAALPVGAALHPAGADTVTGLQAQAATVAHDLVLEQLQVDATQQQTSVAASRVAADQQAIDTLDQQLAADQQAIARHLQVVQAQAIRSYIDSGADSSSSDTALFAGGSAQAQAASEYTRLAVGTITTDLAQLHTAQRALGAQQSQLQARQDQDRADAARQSAALGQATAATGQLRAEQAQVTGQLASAVDAQQAAQAKAAAAAVAGARKSAPAASTPPATIPAATAVATPATSTTTPGATATATATAAPAPSPAPSANPFPGLADPALNAFLSCVVQAESGGDYAAVSPGGLYRGAFQFSQSTWDSAAGAAGLGLLVGVPPNLASRAEQDTVAVALFAMDGQQPWLGDRCSQG